MGNNNNFVFNWVLVNELAISNLPENEENLDYLKLNKISSVITLCEKKKLKNFERLKDFFNHKIIVLPDHKSDYLPKKTDLLCAIDTIYNLKRYGPILIHCEAAVERSPLICIGYLMKYYNYNFIESLEYMMEIHPLTSPMNSHIEILKKILN